MPLVKTSFAIVRNDSSLIDPDRHSDILVALCRQIGELALCCDLLVGELAAEINKIASRTQSLVERTSKLAVKVESLDYESTTLRKFIKFIIIYMFKMFLSFENYCIQCFKLKNRFINPTIDRSKLVLVSSLFYNSSCFTS